MDGSSTYDVSQGMCPRGVLLGKQGRLVGVKRSPHACPGLLAGPGFLGISGRNSLCLCVLITHIGSGTHDPRPGLASACPQHCASSLGFSGDQTLSSLSLASFDASLRGCKAVLVSCYSNGSEVISVPASVERMGLEGGSPAAPRFLPSVCSCRRHLFSAFVVLYMETGTLF